MKSLTPSERRTLRLGSIALAIYLVAFFGVKWLRAANAIRDEHRQLSRTATSLKAEVERYQIRAERLARLMNRLQIDPASLRTNTVVGHTSSALQQAAQAQGLQVGSIRESPSRSSERELGSIQFDATGPTQAILAFLARLDSLGVPVVIDSIQCSGNPRGPGQLKLQLQVIILDFDQWKPKEPSRA
jgi:hypothetical protein